MSVQVVPSRSRSMLTRRPVASESSPGASEASVKIAGKLRGIKDSLLMTSAPLGVSSDVNRSAPLAEQLRNRNSELKRMIAIVAMHLDDAWRNMLLSSLDRLLDSDDWDDGFDVPDLQSFSTLLRAIVYLHPTKRPGVGLSQRGTFLSAWRQESDRLVLEYLPEDEIRWVINRTIDGEKESGAGTSQIHRIPEVIAPYHPEPLFNDGI